MSFGHEIFAQLKVLVQSNNDIELGGYLETLSADDLEKLVRHKYYSSREEARREALNMEVGDTLLHSASSVGMCQLLIEYGADIEATDNKGQRPLHYAAINNNPEVVKYLISQGANPCVSTFSGVTPLELAVSQGALESFQVLLRYYNNRDHYEILVRVLEKSRGNLERKSYSFPVGALNPLHINPRALQNRALGIIRPSQFRNNILGIGDNTDPNLLADYINNLKINLGLRQKLSPGIIFPSENRKIFLLEAKLGAITERTENHADTSEHLVPGLPASSSGGGSVLGRRGPGVEDLNDRPTHRRRIAF